MTIADLEWIRASWDGPLIIKGIQTVEDARRVTDAGADAIVLSNHGGRQLDRAPVPLRLLPDVAEAVGDRTQVWVDTGIMSGADIVAALALGADATLVGRAYLYGLMAGGERGVDRAVADPRARDPPHHGPPGRLHGQGARPPARPPPLTHPRNVRTRSASTPQERGRCCACTRDVRAEAGWSPTECGRCGRSRTTAAPGERSHPGRPSCRSGQRVTLTLSSGLLVEPSGLDSSAR